MKNSIKIIILKYSISFAIMVGFLFLILGIRNYFNAELDLVTKYRYLTDAFTIPGMLFILVGLLVILTNQGSLASLAWLLRSLFFRLIPGGSVKKNQTYKEYLETRKKITGYGFLFISGAIFFLVGIIFLILFYTNYQR